MRSFNAVEENLDYEIITQQEDGSWPATWSWGDNYPDVWSKVKINWFGSFSAPSSKFRLPSNEKPLSLLIVAKAESG
jgi:hypothetical protein